MSDQGILSAYAVTVVAMLLGSGAPARSAEKPTAPSVQGRLVVVGAAPEPTALGPGRDACCQDAAPRDQSLRVGPTGGLAGVLVSVEPRRGELKPPASPPPVEPVVLTNRGCAFEPRLLLARVGQPLVLENADPTMHNVNIAFVRNPRVNVVVEPDGRRELMLRKPERRPVGVRCNVHTFMSGWVAVREDQHAEITDESGAWSLPELPAGTWRLRFWHEGRPLAGLEIGEKATDSWGETVLEVPAGGLDLGETPVAIEDLLATP